MLDKSQLSLVNRSNNFSAAEIQRFDALAESWWDPNGHYKRVLDFNAMRWQRIKKQVEAHFALAGGGSAWSQLSVLDIGCGGGLLCEPFAVQGASVTGIDASQMSIEVAKAHAKKSSLDIDYRHCLSDELLQQPGRFDVVVNTEVIEHVPDQQALLAHCCQLLKPGGLLVLGTLNRTLKSYVFAIVGAEYVLKLLPKGTHDWRLFVKPAEMQSWLAKNGCASFATEGVAFNPFTGNWRNTADTSVNYLMFARHAV